MRVLVQRVKSARVEVAGEVVGASGHGLLLLVGVEADDGEEDLCWLSSKLTRLRIFDDENGVMNLSVQDVNGEIMIVSQFTLHARTRKGNRPSYIDAAKPEISIPMYEKFCKTVELLLNKPVKTGEFGADMQVNLVNDGPVTIWMDSKKPL